VCCICRNTVRDTHSRELEPRTLTHSMTCVLHMPKHSEGGREGGREGEREEGKEGEREGGREGGRERDVHHLQRASYA